MITGYFSLLLLCAVVARLNLARRRIRYWQIIAERREQRIVAAVFERLRISARVSCSMRPALKDMRQFRAEVDHALNLLRRHS